MVATAGAFVAPTAVTVVGGRWPIPPTIAIVVAMCDRNLSEIVMVPNHLKMGSYGISMEIWMDISASFLRISCTGASSSACGH